MRIQKLLITLVLLVVVQLVFAQQAKDELLSQVENTASPLEKVTLIDQWVDSIMWYTEYTKLAIPVIEKGLELSDEHDLIDFHISLTIHKLFIQVQGGNFEESLATYPSLIEQTKDTALLARVYNVAGLTHLYIRDTDKARNYYEKGLQLLNAHAPKSKTIASIHSNLTLYHNFTSQIDSAIYCGNLALDYYRSIKDSFNIIQELIVLSHGKRTLGAKKEAVEILLNANDMCDKNNVHHRYLQYYVQLYLSEHYETSDQVQSLEISTNNIELIKNDKKLPTTTKVDLLWAFYNTKSNLLIEFNRPEEALIVLEESINLSKEETLYPVQVFSTNLLKIEALILMGSYNEADELLQDILNSPSNAFFEARYTNILSLFNDLYSHSELKPSAQTRSQLNQMADQVINKNNGLYNNSILQAHLAKTIINAAASGNQASLQHFVVANQVKDSLAARSKADEINKLLIEYKTKEQAAEIKIKDLELDKKNNLLLKYIAFSVIAGLVIIILFVSFYQKERYAKKLEKIVSQRTKQLSVANKQLQQSNAELEQFTYIFSHDLKEPLRSITNFSQILPLKLNVPEDQRQLFDFINTSATSMHNLIDETQTYLELRDKTPHISQTDIENALTNMHAKSFPDIELNILTDLPSIHTDAEMLNIIFKHLFDNAKKYNDNEVVKVNVSYRQEQNQHKVAIADNGIGISPEYYQHIFSIFTRLHDKNKYKGSGVGLAICNQLVQKLGGTIHPEKSKTLDGSKFVISLPFEHNTQYVV